MPGAGRADARRPGPARCGVVEVETDAASPFARSLLFGYVGAFLYEGDAPLAERRAQALALDTGLLAELLGRSSCASCSTREALAEIEAELQRLPAERHPRDADGAAELLRVRRRPDRRRGCRAGRAAGVAGRAGRRPAARCRSASPARSATSPSRTPAGSATRSAWRCRSGVPEAFTEPVADPLGDLVGRFARTHGPFQPAEAAARLGLGVAVVDRHGAAARPAPGGWSPASSGPGGGGQEWCDAEVLRSIRRRSLAALRQEIEPVADRHPGPVHARLAVGRRPAARCGRRARGRRAARRRPGAGQRPGVAGAAGPGADYSPAMLDELTSAGEVLWAGAGGLPGGDGWITLVPADLAPLLLPEPLEIPGEGARRCSSRSAGGQALFFRGLSDAVGATDDTALADLVWDLVWAGRAHQRHAGAAARPAGRRRHPPRQAGRSARPHRPAAAAAPGSGGRRCRPAPVRPRWPAAGPGCPTARPAAPAARPRGRRRCSNGTGCSPGAR